MISTLCASPCLFVFILVLGLVELLPQPGKDALVQFDPALLASHGFQLVVPFVRASSRIPSSQSFATRINFCWFLVLLFRFLVSSVFCLSASFSFHLSPFDLLGLS